MKHRYLVSHNENLGEDVTYFLTFSDLLVASCLVEIVGLGTDLFP